MEKAVWDNSKVLVFGRGLASPLDLAKFRKGIPKMEGDVLTKAMIGFNNTTDGDTIQSMLLNKCMSLLLANCRIVNKTTVYCKVLKNFKYQIYKELHMYIVNFVLSFEFI